MNEFKNNIDLAPLSDETIAERKYSLSDLWMAKDENNEVYGPFPTDELREYSRKYKYLFDNVSVYNLETEKWYRFFEVKHFQRRKPQLVSAQNLINDNNFFVLANGQKRGPYTLEKMQDLLATGHITPNTQISLDGGESWIKLYEHHAFDRRSKKKNGELPFIPNKEILFEEVKNQNARLDESDPLFDLAYYNANGLKSSADEKTLTQAGRSGILTKSQIMKNPINDLDNEKTIVGEKIKVDIKKTTENETSEKSKFGVIFASLVLLVGLGFGANHFWSGSNSGNQIKEAQTASPGINNSDRSVSQKQVRTKTLRKPASTKKVTRRKPKRIQPKRYVPKPRRVEQRVEVYNEPEEPLDINDPDVQEELTRSLAGDLDDEGLYPEDEDRGYDDQPNGVDIPPIDEYQDEYQDMEPQVLEDDSYYDEPPPQEEDYGYDAEYN